MPKRPRPHQLEDLSRNRLHNKFEQAGWTVEDLTKDYGEDLLVRIFQDGNATPLSFFVQAKATDNIERYLKKDKEQILYPIATDHLQHWDRFWEPVILTVWDSKADITYWEFIQKFIDESLHDRKTLKNGSKISVPVPIGNKLNEEGIRRIYSRTKTRFERFAREKEGAEQLIDVLKEQLGIEIEYNPQSGILFLPQGKFIPDDESGKRVIFFGKMAAMLADMQAKLGVSTEHVVDGALDFLLQVLEAYQTGSKLALMDKEGAIINSWESYEELNRYIERESELNDAEK
jgi:hypothetical protein